MALHASPLAHSRLRPPPTPTVRLAAPPPLQTAGAPPLFAAAMEAAATAAAGEDLQHPSTVPFWRAWDRGARRLGCLPESVLNCSNG